jgi:NAD(P)-dependent dehydrogenase (short-subunit alcohol dehydrogenase family)
MASLHDKVIAVSGAGSGIGLATAKYLYSQGARLSLTDINGETLKSAALQIAGGPEPKRIFTIATDVRVSKQVDAWIDETVAHFGALDGAANLAGVVGKHIGQHGVADLSDEEWSFVMDVNITGVFFAMRAQIRSMKKLGKGGSIVNASSIAGISGFPMNASYTAAKHGVVGITRSAAKEVGGEAIRVNAIAP